MEQHYCQSCSMPMTEEAVWGSEADGTRSADYCGYCYENGQFAQPDMTMKGMIEVCVPYMIESGMEESKARELLDQVLPQLKRWKL